MHIEGGRIYESTQRKAIPLGMIKRTTDGKRQEIDEQLEKFLAAGGKITELPGCQMVPKPPHKPPAKVKTKEEPDQEVRARGRAAIGWPESVHLKDQLAAANITYRQLAEQAGVPRLTLARWIQKIQIPSHAWKNRIAEALQLLLMKNGKTPTPKTR